jgi:alpha-beta hydrolase superfamily lysophospholipase
MEQFRRPRTCCRRTHGGNRDYAPAAAELPHYLIGHSHGGNVAISASLALERQAVAGVICLATPILTTCRRRLSKSRQIMVGFGFFLVLYLPFIDRWSTRGGEPTGFELWR